MNKQDADGLSEIHTYINTYINVSTSFIGNFPHREFLKSVTFNTYIYHIYVLNISCAFNWNKKK